MWLHKWSVVNYDGENDDHDNGDDNDESILIGLETINESIILFVGVCCGFEGTALARKTTPGEDRTKLSKTFISSSSLSVHGPLPTFVPLPSFPSTARIEYLKGVDYLSFSSWEEKTVRNGANVFAAQDAQS